MRAALVIIGCILSLQFVSLAGQSRAPIVTIKVSSCGCIHDPLVVTCTLVDPDHVCKGTDPIFEATAEFEVKPPGQNVKVSRSSKANEATVTFEANSLNKAGNWKITATVKTMVSSVYSTCASTTGPTVVKMVRFEDGKLELKNVFNPIGEDYIVAKVSGIIAEPGGGAGVLEYAWSDPKKFDKLHKSTATQRSRTFAAGSHELVFDDTRFFPTSVPLDNSNKLTVTGTYHHEKCKCDLAKPLVELAP